MSILIRDMEMPKGNDELRLIIHSNGQVIISHQTYYEEAEAVSISPHGDLIDKRMLINDISNNAFANADVDSKEEYDFWNRVWEYIRKIPIVVESEDGK